MQQVLIDTDILSYFLNGDKKVFLASFRVLTKQTFTTLNSPRTFAFESGFGYFSVEFFARLFTYMKNLFLVFGLSLINLQLIAQTDSLIINNDSIASEQIGNNEIIDPVETMPQFPGGQDSLRAFIERNNNWRVGKKTIVGKVFVGFVIEADGTITNTEILKGLDEECDAEALRIVSLMPKWKPGEFRGQTMRTKMILPITFDGMK